MHNSQFITKMGILSSFSSGLELDTFLLSFSHWLKFVFPFEMFVSLFYCLISLKTKPQFNALSLLHRCKNAISNSIKHGYDTRCQFHQRFYIQIFCTNVVLSAFSSYVLALAKNLYEKRPQKTVMKLVAVRY